MMQRFLQHKTYREFLAELFPGAARVRKVMLDAGFSCPNLDGSRGYGGCSFCNNQSFSPAERAFAPLDQLERGVARMRTKYPGASVLAYFQAHTNTHASVLDLKRVLDPVFWHSEVAGISLGTRPDCLPEDVCDLLAEYNLRKPVIVEVGLQTAKDATLLAINRLHSAAEYGVAMERLRRRGLATSCHLIVGLPGEGLADFEATARFVAEQPLPSAVKIHPLHIVKGTALAKEWEQGLVSLPSLEEYALAVVCMLRTLPPSVAVERLSGDSLGDMGLAPAWAGDRNAIALAVERMASN